jgi:cytochrome c biogenesis protein CcdA
MEFHKKLYLWLLNRADKQAENVWIFTLGAVFFFFGMGIILYSENTIVPSLGQELIVLFGFILAILGGIAAIMGYLSLSLLRFLRFASRERIKAPTDESITDSMTEPSQSPKKVL